MEDGRCQFLVWAPCCQKVEVVLNGSRDRCLALERDEGGYHRAILEDIPPGTLYTFKLDGKLERPDPASRFQPQGVHGPSQVVDPRRDWGDQHWTGISLENYIIYELHVGTFTPEGTFEAMIPHLDRLKKLGITCLELMPVAQFPGSRNWGYDGVYPFSVQNSYGGPEKLKDLVEACHHKGLGVILDVVYNHLGPEGNYLGDFGPYFSSRATPWGAAPRFHGPGSADVRRFFIQNALHWIRVHHVDALRLDAVHAIRDGRRREFLTQLAGAVRDEARALGREVFTIAESNLNNPRLVRPRKDGGLGLDSQWVDDFHHSLHALLTGERGGYYRDFGRVEDLAKSLREGFVFSGQYSSYRKREHGSSSVAVPGRSLVVYSQNHDQVGNRMRGERLSSIISLEALKLAAGTVLLSPYIPLLFMGEEYGETRPFQYFTSHSVPSLAERVRRGRKREFSRFHWQGEPPDPQDEATFQGSKLQGRATGHQRVLFDFYRELIRLRKELPALVRLDKEAMEVVELKEEKVIVVRRLHASQDVFLAFNFASTPSSPLVPLPAGQWKLRLSSADQRWHGPGSNLADGLLSEGDVLIRLRPHEFGLFVRKEAS